MKLSILSLLLIVAAARAELIDENFLRRVDPLAPRDEWGLLHQMREVNAVDFAQRYPSRWFYYFKASEQLTVQPAYIGALQRELRRLGYYCGPIDGIYSPEVGDAIASLQKNSSMRVTGTLTDSVRRALHLP
jgi:putative peptidoglycan binding protein